jgi:hypothetical protein
VSAAVGLSYSSVQADYSTNDTATAADSNAFLRGFFRRYPHLAGNNFYISGGGTEGSKCFDSLTQACVVHVQHMCVHAHNKFEVLGCAAKLWCPHLGASSGATHIWLGTTPASQVGPMPCMCSSHHH